MSAESILDEIGDEQGWNDQSKIELLCQYIDNQGDNDCFADFLRTQQAEEVGMVDVGECKSSGSHLTSCDDDGFCNYCGEQE